MNRAWLLVLAVGTLTSCFAQDGCDQGTEISFRDICLSLSAPGTWLEAATSCQSLLTKSKNVTERLIALNNSPKVSKSPIVNKIKALSQKQINEIWLFEKDSILFGANLDTSWEYNLLDPFMFTRWKWKNSSTESTCLTLDLTTKKFRERSCDDLKLSTICVRSKNKNWCPETFSMNLKSNAVCGNLIQLKQGSGWTPSRAKERCSTFGPDVSLLTTDNIQDFLSNPKSRLCDESSLVPLSKAKSVSVEDTSLADDTKDIALNLTSGEIVDVSPEQRFKCVLCQVKVQRTLNQSLALNHSGHGHLVLTMSNYNPIENISLVCRTDASTSSFSTDNLNEISITLISELNSSKLSSSVKSIKDNFFIRIKSGKVILNKEIEEFKNDVTYSINSMENGSKNLEVHFEAINTGHYWCVGTNSNSNLPISTDRKLVVVPNNGRYVRYAVSVETTLLQEKLRTLYTTTEATRFSTSLAEDLDISDGVIELKRISDDVRLLFHVTLPPDRGPITPVDKPSKKIVSLNTTESCWTTSITTARGVKYEIPTRSIGETYTSSDNCVQMSCNGDLLDAAFWSETLHNCTLESLPAGPAIREEPNKETTLVLADDEISATTAVVESAQDTLKTTPSSTHVINDVSITTLGNIQLDTEPEAPRTVVEESAQDALKIIPSSTHVTNEESITTLGNIQLDTEPEAPRTVVEESAQDELKTSPAATLVTNEESITTLGNIQFDPETEAPRTVVEESAQDALKIIPSSTHVTNEESITTVGNIQFYPETEVPRLVVEVPVIDEQRDLTEVISSNINSFADVSLDPEADIPSTVATTHAERLNRNEESDAESSVAKIESASKITLKDNSTHESSDERTTLTTEDGMTIKHETVEKNRKLILLLNSSVITTIPPLTEETSETVVPTAPPTDISRVTPEELPFVTNVTTSIDHPTLINIFYNTSTSTTSPVPSATTPSTTTSLLPSSTTPSTTASPPIVWPTSPDESAELIDKLTQSPVNSSDLSNITLLVHNVLRAPGNASAVKVLQNLDIILANMHLDEGSDFVQNTNPSVSVLVADYLESNPLLGVSLAVEDGKDVLRPTRSITNTSYPDGTEVAAILEKSVPNSSLRLAFVVLLNGDSFPENPPKTKVNGRVVSVALTNRNSVNVGRSLSSNQYVDVIFRTVQAPCKTPACAYWDVKKDSWSQEGCELKTQNQEGLDVCRCNHLTYFAEIITGGSDIAPGHRLALEVLSIISSALSLIGLLAIAVTAVVFKSWRQELGNQILLSLSAALALNLVMYLLVYGGVGGTRGMGCIAVGALLHYSVLACFCWMLIMSVLQVNRLLTLKGNQGISYLLLKASIFGWIVPLIPVIVVLSAWSYTSNTSMGFQRGFCYPCGTAFYVTLVAPVSLIVLVNIVLFCVILCRICNVFGWGKLDVDLKRHGIPDGIMAMRRLRTLIFLFILFGLTWTLGFLGQYLFFAYLFCLTAPIQGFAIFVFFFVIETRSRTYWKNLYSLGSKSGESTLPGTNDVTFETVPLRDVDDYPRALSPAEGKAVEEVTTLQRRKRESPKMSAIFEPLDQSDNTCVSFGHPDFMEGDVKAGQRKSFVESRNRNVFQTFK